MGRKTIRVRREYLEAVASLIESATHLQKEGLDLAGQPPDEILMDLAKELKEFVKKGGE